MQLEDYFTFLPNGAIRLKGHRIGLEHVVALFREGLTAEEITAALSGVSLEQIHATIAYYLLNQAEIDAYIVSGDDAARRLIQDYDARPAPPVIRRLRDVKAQFRREQVEEWADRVDWLPL